MCVAISVQFASCLPSVCPSDAMKYWIFCFAGSSLRCILHFYWHCGDLVISGVSASGCSWTLSRFKIISNLPQDSKVLKQSLKSLKSLQLYEKGRALVLNLDRSLYGFHQYRSRFVGVCAPAARSKHHSRRPEICCVALSCKVQEGNHIFRKSLIL